MQAKACTLNKGCALPASSFEFWRGLAFSSSSEAQPHNSVNPHRNGAAFLHIKRRSRRPPACIGSDLLSADYPLVVLSAGQDVLYFK